MRINVYSQELTNEVLALERTHFAKEIFPSHASRRNTIGDQVRLVKDSWLQSSLHHTQLLVTVMV